MKVKSRWSVAYINTKPDTALSRWEYVKTAAFVTSKANTLIIINN